MKQTIFQDLKVIVLKLSVSYQNERRLIKSIACIILWQDPQDSHFGPVDVLRHTTSSGELASVFENPFLQRSVTVDVIGRNREEEISASSRPVIGFSMHQSIKFKMLYLRKRALDLCNSINNLVPDSLQA